MKASLERRQSDIDDRAVDEGHAGTDNGSDEYPGSRFCRTRSSDTPDRITASSQGGLMDAMDAFGC